MNKILPFFSQRWVYHSLFWLFTWCLLVYVAYKSTNQDLFYCSLNESINIAFYAVIHYANIFYFVPQYLAKERNWLYILFLMCFTLLITPIKIACLYLISAEQPDTQEYIRTHQYGYYLIALLVAGFSTIAKITSDWARQGREKRELETRTMQSELNFLKTQINPHFLFNTLNSIYALTLKKSDLAPDMVLKLAEMMRYMLYECNERTVSLRKEILYIENYLDLEKLRLGDKVDLQFTYHSLPNKDLLIAPMLLLPFIENSFKHGASNTIAKSFVHIQLRIENEGRTIFFEVINSRPYINTMSLKPTALNEKPSGGIGLVNVNRRLELLYPNRYSLRIDDRATDIYQIQLKLQV